MKTKKITAVLTALCMVLSLMPFALAAEGTVQVVLSDSEITVDGAAITQDTSAAVYLAERVETHEDITEELVGITNRVVTISQAGSYEFSGTATDTQIAVRAGAEDDVKLILNGVDITCRTAAAIQVYTAAEPATPGDAGVAILLPEDSVNNVTGSHTKKTEEDSVKHDAAISSNVSLLIDGSGTLNVTADNEGIEVKNKHLTINGGTIYVKAQDDPINGSEDGVAVITINGGYVFCQTVGQEGDGIDSNGYIEINGGTVIALANPKSMDSGLDSDMGTSINGGTVVGAGNMFDELDDSSKQLYMFLQFAQATDDVICVTDENGTPVFAYDFPNDYSYISFSTPELSEGTYHVYIGGTVEGTKKDGLYTSIASYTGGEQMHHGGVASNDRRPGGMMMPPDFPEGMERPEGMEFPEGMERPERMEPPEGMEFPEGMERPEGEPPQGMGRPHGMNSSAEDEIFDFVLTAESRSFTNVSSAKILTFRDVTEESWFYDAVMKAYEAKLIQGKEKRLFAPNDSVTAAELITMLCRADGNEAEQSTEGNWYDSAMAWGRENALVTDADAWAENPDTVLSREQMMLVLWRFMNHKAAVLPSEFDLSAFSDADSISENAKTAVGQLVAAGLIQGDGDTLRPNDSLTRAETATILNRALDIQGADVHIYPVEVEKELYTAFEGSAEGYFAEGLKTGFGSAITFKGYDEEGNPQFYGATDRGPSLDVPENATLAQEYAAAKIFPAPSFQPSIGVITVKDGKATVTDSIPLKNTDGSALTGLPLPAGELGTTGETALDVQLQELTPDENGFDPEGIAVDSEGNFWLADEYGPFLAKFNSEGVLLKKYSPGNGLPEILKYRIANRGFEGLSISGDKLFASVQSVLDVEGETSKTATFIRILEFDLKTEETKMYAYPVDLTMYKSPKSCKIGDIYAIDEQTLLVIEQGAQADGELSNIVYRVDLSQATDITGLTANGKELEYTQSAEELSQLMSYLPKTVEVNLRSIGWTAEKAEGICMLDDGKTIVLMIEDDFGLSGASLGTEQGAAVVLQPIAEADAAKIWMICLS